MFKEKITYDLAVSPFRHQQMADNATGYRQKNDDNLFTMKKIIITLSISALISGGCKPRTTADALTTFSQTDTQNSQQRKNITLKENDDHSIKILDAEKIISESTKIGLKKLEEIVDPIKLTCLDSLFSATLIELEFKNGFLEQHYSNENVYIYNLPKYTFELAEEHNNKEAQKKLFEYYTQIPKFVKSDTIYSIYNDLNTFLKVLVKYSNSNPNLPKRLSEDYKKWSDLAKVSEPKSYLSVEEYRNMSFEENMKFREEDLYVDCPYITLQLAGALNYLKIKGFDGELLERLKKQQTYPFANRYEFKVFDFPQTQTNEYIKVVPNTAQIKNFNDDYLKIEKILFKNIDNCCGSKIREIIYNKSMAYVIVSRNNGNDDYFLKLNTDNTITIKLISMIMI